VTREGKLLVGATSSSGAYLLEVAGAVKATSFIGPGAAPSQYSSFAGTITGTIDGENAVFTLSSAPLTSLVVYVDSARLVVGLHFTWTPGSATITFLAGYYPQPGAVIAAEGW
jgi:hypothetical protein